MKLLILLAVLLSGCNGPAAKSEKPPSNPAYSVDFLFEHDGCLVYRFEDGGNSRYFVNCRGNAATTTWASTTMVGKAPVTTHHSVTTDGRP